jgi:hypothetical protein
MLQDIHSVEIEAGHATPLKAVRRHCLSCCGDSANEVRLCPATACPLWPFRHGHRPNADDRAALADQEALPRLQQQPCWRGALVQIHFL